MSLRGGLRGEENVGSRNSEIQELVKAGGEGQADRGNSWLARWGQAAPKAETREMEKKPVMKAAGSRRSQTGSEGVDRGSQRGEGAVAGEESGGVVVSKRAKIQALL